ncbi:hypothetical protein [Portibacter lacus]|uniref:Uncharacterized protein n=1 Tax=Portibacter lacus TaxID=1099794 RepID=A0AA37SPS6_9BACT|nr:hypothetical protein [Portibacter lacus]GLR16581.1 hypothetical protein GCM10007940_11960 [Portibacter lacus]
MKNWRDSLIVILIVITTITIIYSLQFRPVNITGNKYIEGTIISEALGPNQQKGFPGSRYGMILIDEKNLDVNEMRIILYEGNQSEKFINDEFLEKVFFKVRTVKGVPIAWDIRSNSTDLDIENDAQRISTLEFGINYHDGLSVDFDYWHSKTHIIIEGPDSGSRTPNNSFQIDTIINGLDYKKVCIGESANEVCNFDNKYYYITLDELAESKLLAEYYIYLVDKVNGRFIIEVDSDHIHGYRQNK